MHVLVTGHTGFKGSWLSLLLMSRGHRVSGLALDPEPGGIFDRADVHRILENDVRQDIRDAPETINAITSMKPDAVIHLAAQPLVRASYAEPRLTVDTNVMGTLTILEAISATPSVSAAVMVTTDKVYRNDGRFEGYGEGEALGGRDPYSASKAMADILISSWTASFPGCPIAIARAGNVIGGGDVSQDRLMPDLIRGFEESTPVIVRNPDAVRPWQHVLDCVNGYVDLLEALPEGSSSGAWNFGPDPASFRAVRDVADVAVGMWGAPAAWNVDTDAHPHEEHILTLDSSKARNELGWQDRLDFDRSIAWTIDWHKRVGAGESPLDVTIDQVHRFEQLSGASS